jgi:fused signal recognition particle receptor
MAFCKGSDEAPVPTEEMTPSEARERDMSAGLVERFRRAIARTRQSLSERFQNLAGRGGEIDPASLEQLEEILLAADIGPRTTMEILDVVRAEWERKSLRDLADLKRLIHGELLTLLAQTASRPVSEATVRPQVFLVVGVNGTGKTTTIGKLAYRFKSQGQKVLLCGADTFRAAASDQLAIWAQRAGVPLIEQKPGTDPAAVLFDSLRSAKARGMDVVIVDTAGRLHTKVNLMAELQKMCRVAAREVEGAPHEVWLVLDAITGQNGLEQARQFTRAVNVTGIILTKLDGTAKGGIVVAIAKELKIPIRWVGVGEGIEDLVEFSPHAYTSSLLDDGRVP